MEPSYDEDDVPVDGAAETDEGEDNGKISQAEAHYRRGSPVKHCGVCMHFNKAADDGNEGACTKVAGAISPYGLSDVYAEARNPFGPMLGPQERGMVDEMSQSGPDQSRFAQVPAATTAQPPGGEPAGQPPVSFRIGRQAYG